jgi:hypothetical protein
LLLRKITSIGFFGSTCRRALEEPPVLIVATVVTVLRDIALPLVNAVTELPNIESDGDLIVAEIVFEAFDGAIIGGGTGFRLTDVMLANDFELLSGVGVLFLLAFVTCDGGRALSHGLVMTPSGVGLVG